MAFAMLLLSLLIAAFAAHADGFKNIAADGKTVYCWVEGDPFYEVHVARSDIGAACKVAAMALQGPIGGVDGVEVNTPAEVNWEITFSPDNDIIKLYNNTMILGMQPAGSITENGVGIVSVFQGNEYDPFNSTGKAIIEATEYSSVGTTFAAAIQFDTPGEFVVMTQAQFYYNRHVQLNFAIFSKVTVDPVEFDVDGKSVYCWNLGDPFDANHVVFSASGAACKVDEFSASVPVGSVFEVSKPVNLAWKIKLNPDNDIIKLFNNTMMDGMEVVGPMTANGLGYADAHAIGVRFDPYDTDNLNATSGVSYTATGATFSQTVTFLKPGEYALRTQAQFHHNRHIEFNFAIFTKVTVTGARC